MHGPATPKKSYDGVHLLRLPLAGALFPHELRAAITVTKPAHLHDSWELDFDSCSRFMMKCRALLRTDARHAFPSLGLRYRGIQCARDHSKHPVYRQSSRSVYRMSYRWSWNQAGPREEHSVSLPAICLYKDFSQRILLIRQWENAERKENSQVRQNNNSLAFKQSRRPLDPPQGV